MDRKVRTILTYTIIGNSIKVTNKVIAKLENEMSRTPQNTTFTNLEIFIKLYIFQNQKCITTILLVQDIEWQF